MMTWYTVEEGVVVDDGVVVEDGVLLHRRSSSSRLPRHQLRGGS